MELAKTGQYSASEGRFNTLTGYVAEMQITAERRQKMTSDDRQLAGSRNSYIVVLGESLAWQVVSEFTDESPPSVVRIEKKPSHLKTFTVLKISSWSSMLLLFVRRSISLILVGQGFILMKPIPRGGCVSELNCTVFFTSINSDLYVRLPTSVKGLELYDMLPAPEAGWVVSIPDLDRLCWLWSD